MPLWQILGEQLDEKKIQEKVVVIKENGKKVAEQLRRNSDCLPKSSMAKYLGSLLKELKLWGDSCDGKPNVIKTWISNLKVFQSIVFKCLIWLFQYCIGKLISYNFRRF